MKVHKIKYVNRVVNRTVLDIYHVDLLMQVTKTHIMDKKVIRVIFYPISVQERNSNSDINGQNMPVLEFYPIISR